MHFAIFLSNFAADDFSKKALENVKDTKIGMKPKKTDFFGDYTFAAVAFREVKLF